MKSAGAQGNQWKLVEVDGIQGGSRRECFLEARGSRREEASSLQKKLGGVVYRWKLVENYRGSSWK